MQLVELQRTVQSSSDGKVAVFAVSYDSVDILAEFAAKHEITYPLLSDVGSLVITELGLLNVEIEKERAFWGKPMDDRHRGIPYPGTFVLDSDGVVVEKLFERSHRIRPGGNMLLERLSIDAPAPEKIVTADGPGLTVAAWPDSGEYFPNQINHLTVRVSLADDLHVYVPPNPPGFSDLSIDLDVPDGVFVDDYPLPSGHDFSIEGLPENFTVVEGEFDLSIPFYILEDSGDVSLTLKVGYQACSPTTCMTPETLDLTITLSEVRA
jgi:peroxiredoxin